MILAKSIGKIELVEHSKLVQRFAVEIYKQCSLEYDDEIAEGIRIASLLHDIGKCTNQFQSKINKEYIDDSNIENKLPYLHNEIGWAFLTNFLNIKNRIVRDIVLDVVYWHHGLINKAGTYNNQSIKISQDDTNVMLEYSKRLIGEENLLSSPTKKLTTPPQYYHGIGSDIDESQYKNAVNTLCRMCVISADHMASAFMDSELSDIDITNIAIREYTRTDSFNLKGHKYYGNKRFKAQNRISKKVQHTTAINAPAGFGKTMVGLMFTQTRTRKLIWICPRNQVVNSVYKIITKELDDAGVHNISVESFIAGEVKEHNGILEMPHFSSDIIITNIDNYLTPVCDGKNINSIYTLLTADVIFDEYHEFPTNSALFAGFINMMNVRNKFTNGKTLLLSATPTTMHFLWESISQKTTFLPKENDHYPPAHSKRYLIEIPKEFDIDENIGGELLMLNSITNAQKFKHKFNSDLLVHSSFTEEDRGKIMDNVYGFFDKDSNRAYTKPNVISAPVLQASMDISFLHLSESVLSPEGTMQRIGRCDRWGDYWLVLGGIDRMMGNSTSKNNIKKYVTSKINILNYSNPSENAVRDLMYTRNLSEMWFDYIAQFDERKLSLKMLYKIYNNYNIENKDILNEYLMNTLGNSIELLSKIYPIKFIDKRKRGEIKTAGGNKLRTLTSEVFVICKIYNSKKYTSPFSVQTYGDFSKTFDESGNVLNRLLKTMKEIRNMNDNRYDYNDILNDKNITLDSVRKLGKKSNTPYIRFDKVYHPEYGVIRESDLIKYLK